MKKIFDFGNFELQYWIDEFSEVPEVPTETTYEAVDGPRNIDSVKAAKICVELFLHKDANNYGLLGIEFIPQKEADHLEIQIKYTKESTEHYQSDIKIYDSMICCGLYEEYVPCLKDALVKKICSLNEFYCGKLIVCTAANSMVGSSSMIFAAIANIIIEMFLAIQNEGIDKIDEHIGETVQREYHAIMQKYRA